MGGGLLVEGLGFEFLKELDDVEVDLFEFCGGRLGEFGGKVLEFGAEVVCGEGGVV